MFHGASSFNANIGSWNVSKVRNFRNVFRKTDKFDQDISGWQVSNGMYFIGMFEEAKAFDHDISGWDTSSAMETKFMFRGASSFNHDLSSWVSANICKMRTAQVLVECLLLTCVVCLVGTCRICHQSLSWIQCLWVPLVSMWISVHGDQSCRHHQLRQLLICFFNLAVLNRRTQTLLQHPGDHSAIVVIALTQKQSLKRR